MYSILQAREKYFDSWSTCRGIFAVELHDAVDGYLQEQVFFQYKKDAYHFANFCLQNGVDVSVKEYLYYTEDIKRKKIVTPDLDAGEE